SGRGIDFPESESRRILSELEGKRELIELLVENGAKFGGWFEFALSDLAELCDGADGYLGIIEFLLDCGANVNSVSWRGNPLLHTAVWLQNMELVEFLLARHADFRATGRRCRDTLLHIAAARRAKKSNGMFKNSNTSKLRFLNMAKKSEDLDMINLILGFHLDINAKNELDQTPLHVAVTTNNLSIVRCLLDNGAAPNVLNGKGETSLDVAVLYSREAIALLKEHGGKHSFELYFD
ncbi:MAG: ankyrin repeat domain-containing protein, partial [Holosporaceae bacterium]|nr:ankyrin repeat domain-containing protein [Holosporaceae bacterium]